MPATIYDVATYAGVSVATVSRIVNGTGKVSPKTTARVNDAIEKLQFRPNALGRNLSTAKTRTIGVVLPSMSNPVFADVVAGVNEMARENGITLMLTMTEYDQAAEEMVVNSLLSYQPEGVILTVADPVNSRALKTLSDQNIPHVLVYNQPGCRNCTTVTVDNKAAGSDVANHLIREGHTRLGMITGSFEKSDRAEARWKGFSATARHAGLAEPHLYEINFVDPGLETVIQAFREDPDNAPTALFCSNDLLAISAIGAFGRAGFRVPQDISIIGFDGISIGAQLHPTLATVVQPSREMGREAMAALLSRISGGEQSGAIVLPHVLRSGESAGPACKPGPADLSKPTEIMERDTRSWKSQL